MAKILQVEFANFQEGFALLANMIELSQQQTRPIAHIQKDVHRAVLLSTLCIDRMHGIDNKEMPGNRQVRKGAKFNQISIQK